MLIDRRPVHERLKQKLQAELKGNNQPIRVRKKTISNLFRYEGRTQGISRQVDLRAFDKPLYIDTKGRTLEVQGLTTYEAIVDFVLPQGYLPYVTPELKHITVGGATVGIGIETTSFRYGFVHDSLLEAEVLLPSGEIVVCRPDNEYADLFHGLPNSYGTLGYILRVVMKLKVAKPYVQLETHTFSSRAAFLRAMHSAAQNTGVNYLESLIYGPNEFYLVTSRETSRPKNLRSIYGPTIFYREISRPGNLALTTKDYLFRYDPEWFWALPLESSFYRLFRRLAPARYRNSSFYARFSKFSDRVAAKLPFLAQTDNGLEQLIQDWEVPWAQADALLKFALDNLDLDGKPLMAAPVITPATATCYPMQASKMYLNLGSYNFVRKQPSQAPYANTRLMDDFCFAHDGIKMLYSSSFLPKATFDKLYNGKVYSRLKRKYDPKGLAPTLYDKAVKAH